MARMLPLRARRWPLRVTGFRLVGLNTLCQVDAAVVGVSVRSLEAALDTGDEVEIAVKCGFGG
jgi:hypothetical protein